MHGIDNLFRFADPQFATRSAGFDASRCSLLASNIVRSFGVQGLYRASRFMLRRTLNPNLATNPPARMCGPVDRAPEESPDLCHAGDSVAEYSTRALKLNPKAYTLNPKT